MKSTRYYDLILVGMVAVLLCSNLIGPGKLCEVTLPLFGPIQFGAGNLFFPISYIFGDILTEVYGYARARRAIWAGFASVLFASVMTSVILALPIAVNEPYNQVLQPALLTVFGATWRIVLASMLAYWVGDFINSFVLAKLKVLTQGRWLWTRTIGSTICGQGVDSLIFYPIAFYGVWTQEALIGVMLFNFGFKLAVEVLFTPVTYLVINRLKRSEGFEVFDTNTKFTPFSLKG